MHENIEITEEERDGGFTLVELLIVIVILGILAAVTVFAVSGITDQARSETCKVAQQSARTAAAAWSVENDGATYTGDVQGLITAGNLDGEFPADCDEPTFGGG